MSTKELGVHAAAKMSFASFGLRATPTGLSPRRSPKGCLLDGTWAAGPSSEKESQPEAIHHIFARGIVTGWRRRGLTMFRGGPTVTELNMTDCTNPVVQISQLKKALADMGHAVPETATLTLEQRVQALEQKAGSK